MADFQVHSDGPSTLFLSGELDLATLPTFEMAMAAVSDGPITLDISRMTFMDSKGAGAIAKASEKLSSGCIILHGVGVEVRRVIDILALEKMSKLHVVPCDVLI
jgi:anti-anti-sigma factor